MDPPKKKLARKLLTEYTTPLGSGAGVPKKNRPNPITDDVQRLVKPFKIPFKARDPKLRAQKQVDYTVLDQETTKENYQGQRIRGSLNPRRLEQGETKPFVLPLKDKSQIVNMPPPPLGTKPRVVIPPRPLHDPLSEFAIVLYDPTVDRFEDEEVEAINSQDAQQQQQDNEEQQHNPRKRVHKSLAEILGITVEKDVKYPDVPVVIDPKLAKILRPHQIEGVKFLYKCTSGLMDPRAKGCIMADEMGLGKTLQCLTLMWTLLKQSPRGRKTIHKCIIVCPSSLVRNWANEIVKWLGEGVLTPLAIDGKSVKNSEIAHHLSQWSVASGRNVVRPVLIISYETLRRHVDSLRGTEVGLLLADEGHRLKNGDSLTFMALNELNCQRRVILSGTPIQNDLSEYFSLLNFANPGYLGTRNEFKRNFENSILRGRDADATDDEIKNGDAKLAELSTLVSKFIIRRTNDILSKYLPIKYEHVIFVNLSPLQTNLYNLFVTSPEIKKLLRGVDLQPLKAVGMLKKLCNHPELLNLPQDLQGSEALLPEDYHQQGRAREVQTWLSGKFAILERFLYTIRTETDDKIVLISNYTQTLDLIERMCRYKKYGCFRLDGSLSVNKRQKLVDKFNDPQGQEFVFLLSSKAGGCGINLIGANRLVLIDPDWNPASDQQALARVWRDGQKKDCFIYRFISTGSIEEKIFQRQSMKLSLSSCVVDEKEDVERLFSADNLRALFQFQTLTNCDTHDTYNCKRCVHGKQQAKAPAMLYGDPTTWNHLDRSFLSANHDTLLRNELAFSDISYIFQYISH